MRKLLVSGFLMLAATQAQSVVFDCNSDCHEEAKFRYPCPTFRNPRRMCTGLNHPRKLLCETDKAASCRLWNAAVEWFSPRVKPLLVGEFNAANYQESQVSGETAQYMAYCTGAATAACATVGAQVGGPYGALIGGAGGAFISYQICKQSTVW